ncbi:MAG: 23S rRNA (uracil(1939)-C(5))-methyltransferase RlmD [Desulfobacteraceae bacterium 4572_123]|nr:MAG: 23S rRNA (uracil(1939)-C(5))-methyltransferase RlmD [Desulfobacteraceae bacterium 4572_123]
MKVKKGQQLEVVVDDIAFGGRGLVKIDGLAVFVDQAVPGDRAEIRIVKKKKNFAEARVIRLIDSSPFRVTPPCRYAGYCGGCKWQFLDYLKQLEYKQKHVAESIEHIGLLQNITVHEVIPSPRVFKYRNKMEFSCSDRRWLLPEEMDIEGTDISFALGLHVPGTYNKVLDTDTCLLFPDLGNAILEDVRQYMKQSDRPVYGLRSHEGFWRFLMLRHSAAHDRWMVNIVTAAEDMETVKPLAHKLMEKYPRIISIVNNITARKAGIAIGEYEILLAGEACLKDKINDFEFEISANSFFQTNTLGAERLYQTVADYAGLTGSERVADLYSGTGTIAICLSSGAREVMGIEIVESAVADAEKNCALNNVSNCHFISGDIKDCLSKISHVPDVMIIDPPRVGMHKDVVRRVLDMAPRKVVYVSCNPATLARDLNMIKEQYKVLEVQPVDMFPHTFHIESVAVLERI